MFKPRTYQIQISTQAANIVSRLGIAYISAEVRTGKTFTALMTAQKLKAKHVLFVTKKKAISSIRDDYNTLAPIFGITIINYESLHKVDGIFDLIICDEAHCLGSFAKPSKRTKLLKKMVKDTDLIMLSGTMHPESYSQVYHQFWISENSPFKETTFYKWTKNYVNVKERNLGYAIVKDYSDAKIDLIKPIIKPYIITFTQKQAGFKTQVNETVLTVKANALTYQLAKKLKKDKFIIAQDCREVIADTAVKEMQKLHQIYSGTVKFEDGSNRVFDLSKYEFVKDKFKGKKLGIFYKFKAELDALQSVFKDNLTTDLHEFNNTNKHIALQFISGREGVSLRNADYLVAINIDFSATTYFQFRDRLTTMERKENHLYWIFTEGGIEAKIYETVKNKRNFTTGVFKKLYK